MRRSLLVAAGIAGIAAVAGIAADVPQDVQHRGVAATVKVVNAAENTEGSGVVVKRSPPHVYVLTAAHVVRGVKTAEVQVAAGGKVKTYKGAEVLASSGPADLAVLRIGTRDELPALPLTAGKSPAKPGAAVGIGWDKGDVPTAAAESVFGRVRIRRPGETAATACWEVERPLVPRRSGGPLVDAAGAVIGVASGHDGNKGYYVHADEVHAFLRANGLRWLAEPEEK